MKKTGREFFCDGMYYDEISMTKSIPTAKAFCKNCGKETAKPWGYVSFNANLGIAVECEKCGSRYIMYEHLYKSRYEGRHTQYGFIPPTHGRDLQKAPRNVQDKMDAARAVRMKESDERIAKTFGITVEELYEKRKGWQKESAEAHKQFEKERQEFRAELEAQERNSKSAERKRLIEEGVLVWSKSQECLVDTRTNTPYKL